MFFTFQSFRAAAVAALMSAGRVRDTCYVRAYDQRLPQTRIPIFHFFFAWPEPVQKQVHQCVLAMSDASTHSRRPEHSSNSIYL